MKYDNVTEDVVRGPDGFCVPCGFGEAGEMLGKIVPRDNLAEFKGCVLGGSCCFSEWTVVTSRHRDSCAF